MEGAALMIPVVAIVSLFIVLPAMIFHYITLWRRQKTLQPDDEQMMADLWRSAKVMERRLETLEALLDAGNAESPKRPPRSSRSTLDD